MVDRITAVEASVLDMVDPDVERRAAAKRTIGPIRYARNGVALLLVPGVAYEIRTRNTRGAFGFAFEGRSGTACGADAVRPSQRRPNTLSWLPPGCEVESRSLAGGEYLVVEAQDALAGLSAVARGASERERFGDAVDPAAVAAARAIRRTLLAGVEPDARSLERWVETLRGALETRLTRPPGDDLAWLTPARLDAIDRLIERRMAEGPRVSEMAAHLGLSVGFFMRAFKRALGVTPHDYLLQKRLARARRELETTSAPIAEIALACGFTHQSHMTSVMRRELGVTPGAYRVR